MILRRETEREKERDREKGRDVDKYEYINNYLNLRERAPVADTPHKVINKAMIINENLNFP